MTTAPIQFVGGDDFVERFLVESSDGTIADLSGSTITGGVWWRGRKRISLTVGSGIEIVAFHPDRAEDPAMQIQHGVIHLAEAQTVLIPMGAVSHVRLVTVRISDGLTISTDLFPLERVP